MSSSCFSQSRQNLTLTSESFFVYRRYIVISIKCLVNSQPAYFIQNIDMDVIIVKLSGSQLYCYVYSYHSLCPFGLHQWETFSLIKVSFLTIQLMKIVASLVISPMSWLRITSELKGSSKNDSKLMLTFVSWMSKQLFAISTEKVIIQ